MKIIDRGANKLELIVLKKRIDELLKDASKKEFKTIYRVIEAILK